MTDEAQSWTNDRWSKNDELMTAESKWWTHDRRSTRMSLWKTKRWDQLITVQTKHNDNSWQTKHNDELITDEAHLWTHDIRTTIMNSWQTKQNADYYVFFLGSIYRTRGSWPALSTRTFPSKCTSYRTVPTLDRLILLVSHNRVA